MTAVDERVERLGHIYELMRQTPELLLGADRLKAAGDIPGALAAQDRLATLLELQLDATLEYDRRFPEHPFGTSSVVEQLLDALLIEADLFDILGRPDDAEAARGQAGSLGERYQQPLGLAERRRQRAGSLLAKARYHEAANALLESADEFARTGRPLDAAHVASDLAELYEWLGDFGRARDEAARARLMIEPLLGGKAPSFADAFAALAAGAFDQARDSAKLTAVWSDLAQLEGRVARSVGDFDAADVLFEQVRGQVEAFVIPAIDFQFARTEIERGQVTKGLALLQEILPRMSGMLRPKLGAILSWVAEALLRLGRGREAIAIARQSVTELESYQDLDSLWKAQWRLGRAFGQAGDPVAALAACETGVATVTALRRFPMGYRLESTFFADKLPLFDDAIGMAAEWDDAESCYRLIEQVKSRALTSMLTMSAPATEAPGELELAVDELSRQVDALEYRAYRRGWDPEITAERDQLLLERTRLLERIQLADPRWRSLTRPTDPDLPAVTATLAKTDSAALSLYYRSDRIVALLVQRGETRVEVLPIEPETVAAIDRYRRNLESTNPAPAEFDPASIAALAADRLVPRALLDRALDGPELIIVPHGPLHLLPWPALSFRGRRLFEQTAIGILPNMSCLAILEPVPAGPPSIALLGAPSYQGLAGLAELPLAAEEIETAAELFGGRVVGRPRLGDEATQAGYRELLGTSFQRPGILHLACHGDLVAGDPENSGLLLADGRLDAADIARRTIGYDEVVLSACASGYRPTRVGGIELAADDVVGLPGAFLEAGARAVLVSIPRARDDATLAFMTLYFEHRVQGDRPLQALRATQLAMLAAGTYPPHCWVGFLLYGR